MVLTQISSARSRTTGVNTIARYATAASILETFQCFFFLGFHEVAKDAIPPSAGSDIHERERGSSGGQLGGEFAQLGRGLELWQRIKL
jgi:hypothetical protein